jgi:hypothetical protein
VCFLLPALCFGEEVEAKNPRIVIVNAVGYESNLNNTPATGTRGAVNDTKFRVHYNIAHSENLKIGLNAGINSSYRQSGRPLNAQVLQLLPRFNANAIWTPGILRQLDFRTMLDINYSHKFNPYFNNNPADDQTNVLNTSEDDGFHELEPGASHDSGGSADHQNDIGATESANTDVDDDFEDPNYTGPGSGQSYAALKSFARSTYVNNYSSRLSFLVAPWAQGEARLSAMGSYNDVGMQVGLLPASSTAHSYEASLSHEILHSLEISLSYQIEFRKFLERPAFSGSSDMFFIRTHTIPLELTWHFARHMRLEAAYSWIFRDVPLHDSLDTILHVGFLEYAVALSKHISVGLWGGYAFTLYNVTYQTPIDRLVTGLSTSYSF